MLIPRQTHEHLLLDALDYVGVDERCIVLFLVSGDRSTGAIDVAYLPPPDPDDLEYEVFRRVGEKRIYEYRNQHRFAAFQQVEDGPLGGFASELCHEARHAAQFELLGPQFFEINTILRRALANPKHEIYLRIPTEYDANRIAAAFARRRYPAELEAMMADERFRQYTLDYEAETDLLEPTLEMLWRYADSAQPDRDDKTLGEVVEELVAGVHDWRRSRGNKASALCVQRHQDQPAIVEVPGQ